MRILLVDDNEITLEVEKLMLESCGLDVSTASGGAEAVQLAQEQEFSIIFMDIHMPEMDGFTAAELIRKNDSEVTMIALSADEIPETEASFVRSGMNGAMLKPLQISAVKELLSRYMKVDIDAKTAEFSSEDVFSSEELLSVMKNEKAVYRLVNQFLTVHGKDCRTLNENLSSGNITGAREILHNIIGISGNMFCKRLYAASCQLSAEVKRDSSDSLEAFNSIWEETIDRLVEFRKQLSGDAQSEETVDWSKLREEFFALCEDFDVYAADIFVENEISFKANMTAEQFKLLKKAILKYDFMRICDNMEVFNV